MVASLAKTDLGCLIYEGKLAPLYLTKLCSPLLWGPMLPSDMKTQFHEIPHILLFPPPPIQLQRNGETS